MNASRTTIVQAKGRSLGDEGKVLSRDVSQAPAIQQAPISHANEQIVEQRPAQEHEIGQGFGMGM